MSTNFSAKTLLATLSAVVLAAVPMLSAAEMRTDTYNGATCIPYPHNSENGMPFQHYLFGFRQSAFCHFTRPEDWHMEDLSFVMFQAQVATGTEPLRVRLCIYRYMTSECGAERTIPPGGPSLAWVAPPSHLPSYPEGAYLRVQFPRDRYSLFLHYMPVWIR